MADTPVVVGESAEGIGKSWFMQDSSAAGAAYGLIGAMVTVTMDAIMNAGPAARAQKAADELNEVILTEAMNKSLVDSLTAQAGKPAASGVTFASVSTKQRLLKPDATNDAVEIHTSYTLSEDASAMRIVASVSYTNAALAYKTPYAFKSAPPKSELAGPVYANTFTYHSDQFPLPALTPELKTAMIAQIEAAYRDAAGALPVDGTDDFKKMTKDINDAQDDKLSKSEAAIFLVREWLKDGVAPARRELDKAHAFIAQYVMVDLNHTAVPALDGVDELLETMPDQRTVRRTGAGITAGSYISSPGNLSDFTTYGNAVSYAKASREKINTLRSQAKAQKTASK